MSKTLGITGPTGSGKSALCNILSEHGFTVLDCDSIYRDLTRGPSECMRAIEREFGPATVNADGSLNRKALASIVFAEGAVKLLEKLNSITHCHVLDVVRAKIAEGEQNGCTLFAVDAPLLFQAGYDLECDATLAVIAPYKDRLARLSKRDGLPEAELVSRMKSAESDMWFVNRCTYSIFNGGSTESLRLAAESVILDFSKCGG